MAGLSPALFAAPPLLRPQRAGGITRGRSRGVCRVASKAGLQVADTISECAVFFFEQYDALVLKVRTLFKQLEGKEYRR